MNILFAILILMIILFSFWLGRMSYGPSGCSCGKHSGATGSEKFCPCM